MPLASEVTLPLKANPIFPDKCLVCHCKPDSSVKIAHHTQHWLLAFFIPLLMFFGWSKLEIPICKRCKLKYLCQRWARTFFFVTLTVVAVWFIIPSFEGLTGLAKKAAIVGLTLIALIPYIMWEVLCPRIFDTTANPSGVSYEFLSAAYASEFLDLNTDKVIAHSIQED